MEIATDDGYEVLSARRSPFAVSFVDGGVQFETLSKNTRIGVDTPLDSLHRSRLWCGKPETGVSVHEKLRLLLRMALAVWGEALRRGSVNATRHAKLAEAASYADTLGALSSPNDKTGDDTILIDLGRFACTVGDDNDQDIAYRSFVNTSGTYLKDCSPLAKCTTILLLCAYHHLTPRARTVPDAFIGFVRAERNTNPDAEIRSIIEAAFDERVALSPDQPIGTGSAPLPAVPPPPTPRPSPPEPAAAPARPPSSSTFIDRTQQRHDPSTAVAATAADEGDKLMEEVQALLREPTSATPVAMPEDAPTPTAAPPQHETPRPMKKKKG